MAESNAYLAIKRKAERQRKFERVGMVLQTDQVLALIARVEWLEHRQKVLKAALAVARGE